MRTSALLLGLLIALPFVHAGSQADPEIVDESPDVQPLTVVGPSTTYGVPEIDIVAFWFSANETSVTATWQIADATHQFHDNETRLFTVAFNCQNQSYNLDADFNPGYGNWGIMWPDRDVYPVTVEGNLIHTVVPRDKMPCTTLTHLHASSLMGYYEGPILLSGWTWVWFRDLAPDSGYGRDYSFA